jgi:hypothetical protein
MGNRSVKSYLISFKSKYNLKRTIRKRKKWDFSFHVYPVGLTDFIYLYCFNFLIVRYYYLNLCNSITLKGLWELKKMNYDEILNWHTASRKIVPIIIDCAKNLLNQIASK